MSIRGEPFVVVTRVRRTRDPEGEPHAHRRRHPVRARSWFIATSTVLRALSCIPSVVLPPDTATRSILVVTHL
jgi:hypothetical protein